MSRARGEETLLSWSAHLAQEKAALKGGKMGQEKERRGGKPSGHELWT